jgi:hypothetical protein
VKAEVWAACIAGTLLLAMGVLRLVGRSGWSVRALTGLASLALGMTLGLAVWDRGWSAQDVGLGLLAASTAALVVFLVLEPPTGGRVAGVLLAGGVLAALVVAEQAFASSAVALGLAQRLWLYPVRWGALAAGYGAFAVAGLGALSAAGRGQWREDLRRLVDGATVVGLLALGAGVLLEAAWSWLVWGSLWSGQAQLAWNAALVACGAAAVHAWRRGSHLAVQIGLALTGLVLAMVALFSGARLA